ncbi:hypothetical protein, partial [Roseburia faecis]|uniref:hypothetical protein n=1 Tax=Roseburia faecis TaxID=301302 RepID=UPI001A9B802A
FYKDLASHNSKKSKNFKAWWNLPLHWNLLFQVSRESYLTISMLLKQRRNCTIEQKEKANQGGSAP